MANPIKPRPLEQITAELFRMGFSQASVRLFIDTFRRIDTVLTDKGEVKSQANVTGRTEQIGTTVSGLAATGDINATTKIVGRTEGLGTTVSKLTSVGKLDNADSIAADGTGSPLTGGKRGFVALDSNNRLAGTFKNNPLNVNYAPTSATVLSNDGVAHTIVIAASTIQYGDGQKSYNSGSVDPGAFGTYYVYADDSTFAGGAVTYAFSASIPDQAANNGRVTFGAITTVGGSAKTGGGSTGGTTPGGGGGRGVPGL